MRAKSLHELAHPTDMCHRLLLLKSNSAVGLNCCMNLNFLQTFFIAHVQVIFIAERVTVSLTDVGSAAVVQAGDDEQAHDRYRQFRAIRDHADPPRPGGRSAFWGSFLPLGLWNAICLRHPVPSNEAAAPLPAAREASAVAAIPTPGRPSAARLEAWGASAGKAPDGEPTLGVGHGAANETSTVVEFHSSRVAIAALNSPVRADADGAVTSNWAGHTVSQQDVDKDALEGRTIVRMLSHGPGGEEFDAAAAKVAAGMGNPLWQVWAHRIADTSN